MAKKQGNKFIKSAHNIFRCYWLATMGSIALAFAVMMPVIMGSTGMALDLAQSYHMKQRLCGALDAAALAAAAASTDELEIEDAVNAFFDKNYPADTIGTPQQDVDVTVTDNDVTVLSTASYETGFMRLLGIPQLSVTCKTVVNRNVQGLEVALVLDVTGSMNSNDNIGALRTAATNFIDILFDKASDDNFVKIGIVPYSSSVNVGPIGICEDASGGAIADCTPFVNLPPGLNYTTDPNSSDWMGCVLAYMPNGWDPNVSNNDPDPWDTIDHVGPWDIYSYEAQSGGGWQWGGWGVGWVYSEPTSWSTYYKPNYRCPKTPIMALSSDRNALTAHISTLIADGYTLGNFGMAWGYRVVSPEYPFTEAEPWSDTRWNKVIIMMTDGANSMTSYTAYWRDTNHEISASDLNTKFAATCENMKAQGILIYTITFTSGVSDSTKQYYSDCATTPANYHDAPDQDDLIDVFEQISKELSILHVSQ